MNAKKVSLLIAEDEDMIRNSMAKYIISHAAYIGKVHCATNGQEALEVLFEHRPQIMLLDIQMPNKDGLTVMREAAAAGITPSTIILSGHSKFQYAQQALRYGAVDYLLKPCRSQKILQMVDALAKSILNLDESVTGEDTGEAKNAIVSQALAYMKEHYAEQITLGMVAEQVSVNPSYLSTLFTRTLQCSFVECLNKMRIDHACDFFCDRRAKSYEVAFKVGFNDEKYFSNVFKRFMGKSPAEYRKAMNYAQYKDEGTKYENNV
jgi:Response regulator containing CheY-like receiver domain and AraC-type DNA-binding domain